MDISVRQLPVAQDISVYIPDLEKHGVPGSSLPVWRYREEVDKNWQPDPATYPRVVAEPIPPYRTNAAKGAIEVDMRHLFTTATQPVVQVCGRSDSFDIRPHAVHDWVDGKAVKIPVELRKPRDSTVASLFLNTVHRCFADHYPLGIRPEALMWMVVHEVGVCVKEHPEDYRDLFTDSPTKKLIDIQVNDLDIGQFDQVQEWACGVELINRGLKKAMPSDLMDHMLPEISTHDFHSQTATMIAIQDAASPFYDTVWRTCCGIPEVRLFGEGADYDRILTATTELSKRFDLHLRDYFTHLLPVLQEISDTANGRKAPDNDFWASIYNHYSGSGTDDMDGWVTAFVNYTFRCGRPIQKESHLYDWKANLTANKNRWGSGIHRSDIPSHLSSVPFIWNYAKSHSDRNHKGANECNGTNFDCRLVGGFLAVDVIDGFLTPALSFAVLRGDELKTTLHANSWSVQAEGQTEVTAPKRSVFGASNPSGRVDVVEQVKH